MGSLIVTIYTRKNKLTLTKYNFVITFTEFRPHNAENFTNVSVTYFTKNGQINAERKTDVRRG